MKEARIAMAPVGVGPVRAAEAEHFLLDREGGEALWSRAGELALKNANPRDSLVRGSRKYRLEVLPALVREALSMAWEDAGRKEEAQDVYKRQRLSGPQTSFKRASPAIDLP